MHTKNYLLLLAIVCLYACGSPSTPEEQAETTPPTISTAFADQFVVGAALGGSHINGTDTLGQALVAREYNTITPENMMKWEEINPRPGVFNWADPDAFVAFGEENDMFIVGHALVWHSQLSDYVKEITDPELLLAEMKTHIDAVAGRYKGRIDGWDVVNEALNEDGSLRESHFYKVLGEDYLTEAFKMAAAAAGPETKLYYNDYNMWNADKREGAIRMIEKIRANGGRVDGIGMQAHYSVAGPSIDTIEQSIVAYEKAGLPIMMTELDVTVLPNPWDLVGAEVSQNFENSPYMNPFPDALPDSMQTVLADRYEDLFRLYLKHADNIERITFWGVNDGHSWLNGWPISGRTNYPLLFDRSYQKKPVYDRVLSLNPDGKKSGNYNYQKQANEVN
ncbi:endo-1,4-beta-xylanase [Neolewinella agarilytica]|uniref:Beta-xylanase n=1 Tax=Neolewinella agarilytica TaxID=478744 RepID=A0A1H9ECD4_9BACT|nr:endo-1,4-beta-xylanase [Neolewinella agarilytica]SEQ23325.1 endo-1,4-beta-xylanase [Neolewinella agarilytica]